ncbi:hypothetical protein ZWY2020_012814 [Hordeum vulgare]|nr:hypothetical protein ZWY2020_012814 [Hordeum vulgare]
MCFSTRINSRAVDLLYYSKDMPKIGWKMRRKLCVTFSMNSSRRRRDSSYSYLSMPIWCCMKIQESRKVLVLGSGVRRSGNVLDTSIEDSQEDLSVSTSNDSNQTMSFRKQTLPSEDSPISLTIRDATSNTAVFVGAQTNEYKGERIKGVALIPERKRVGRWSDDEDKRLLVSVKIFRSGNWNKIAQFVPSRNQSQCSERWCNVLDSDIDHGEWCPEEDSKLLASVHEVGPCWSKIAGAMIPHRIDNNCLRVCFPMGRGAYQVVHIPEYESVLLTSREKAPYLKHQDPKELKRQRNREYYARNKDDILKRRREARDKKAASTAVLTDQQNETNTAVPMSVDPKELRRQRDRERYARNRDEILKRQRISREKRKTASQLLNDASTMSLTPTTGQTGVTELQRLTCDVTGLSSMQNSSHARIPDNPEINLTNKEDSNWLHRNDAYQRPQRNGCSEIAIDVPLGRLIQPTSSIIRDISEGHLTQNSVVHAPQLSILHGIDSTIEYAGIQPSNGSNQPVNRPCNDARRHAEPASHGEDEDDDPYGIFEPVVEHTSLQDGRAAAAQGRCARHPSSDAAPPWTRPPRSRHATSTTSTFDLFYNDGAGSGLRPLPESMSGEEMRWTPPLPGGCARHPSSDDAPPRTRPPRSRHATSTFDLFYNDGAGSGLRPLPESMSGEEMRWDSGRATERTRSCSGSARRMRI